MGTNERQYGRTFTAGTRVANPERVAAVTHPLFDFNPPSG